QLNADAGHRTVIIGVLYDDMGARAAQEGTQCHLERATLHPAADGAGEEARAETVHAAHDLRPRGQADTCEGPDDHRLESNVVENLRTDLAQFPPDLTDCRCRRDRAGRSALP